MSAQLSEVIIVLGCSVALPVGVTSLIVRSKMHKATKRAEVIMTAIEKNPNIDIKGLVGLSNKQPNGIKTLLMNRLTLGLACLALGLGMLITCIYRGLTLTWQAVNIGWVMTCSVSLMLGLALTMAFVIGKRMFRKDMEQDDENVPTEA